MPLLAGTHAPPPPTYLDEIGFASVTWTAPDGTVWPLTDEAAGWFTLGDGVSGLDAAPVEITRDKQHAGGVRVRHVHPAERIITWPLHVHGRTHQQFVDRWRQVMKAFTQTSRLGPGWLQISRPDGQARRIQAHYLEGFEGAKGLGVLSDSAVISLVCEDPYWQDTTPHTIHRQHAGTPTPFLDPYPTVSTSRVLGATTVYNPGDVDAWPDWVVTGPGGTLTATRTDTGESFQLDPDADGIGHGDLLADEQVFVQTRPARVRFENGDNWTAALNWPAARLWSLPPGSTPVEFELTGSAAGSAIALSFYPRYESA